MGCVFISHDNDDRAAALAVCSGLEEQGIKCWIAERDILPGKIYGEAIIEALEESDVMVLVFSSNSNASRHVVREVERAVKRDMPIITFRIEEVPPSKAMQYFLSAASWCEAFTPPLEEHLAVLANAVKGLMGHARTVQRDYAGRLRAVGELLTRNEYASCIKECGGVFAHALQDLLSDLIELPAQQAGSVCLSMTVLEMDPSKSASPVPEFESLVKTYREANLFDRLRKHLTSNLQKTAKINWEQLVEWYNTAIRDSSSASLDESHAMEMVYCLKVFLFDCELLGSHAVVAPASSIEHASKKCPECSKPLKPSWRFCPTCGAAVQLICKACHRTLDRDFRICPYCETRVPEPRSGAPDKLGSAKDEYRILCAGAYLDGVVNARERTLLEQKRLELGLTLEEAEDIERACAPDNVIEYSRLVEGVLVDGIISEREQVFLERKARELRIDPWLANEIRVAAQEMADMKSKEQPRQEAEE